MAVFTRNVNMNTSGTKKRKNFFTSEKIRCRPFQRYKYFFFHSVYPEKLGDEISKIKISKLGVMTGDFDSVQVYTN